MVCYHLSFKKYENSNFELKNFYMSFSGPSNFAMKRKSFLNDFSKFVNEYQCSCEGECSCGLKKMKMIIEEEKIKKMGWETPVKVELKLKSQENDTNFFSIMQESAQKQARAQRAINIVKKEEEEVNREEEMKKKRKLMRNINKAQGRKNNRPQQSCFLGIMLLALWLTF